MATTVDCHEIGRLFIAQGVIPGCVVDVKPARIQQIAAFRTTKFLADERVVSLLVVTGRAPPASILNAWPDLRTGHLDDVPFAIEQLGLHRGSKHVLQTSARFNR